MARCARSWLCVLLVLPPVVATGQPPPQPPPLWPTLEVTVGLDNNAAAGMWQPVTCLVANETRLPFNGTIRTEIEGAQENPPAVYERPVAVPTPAKQRHTLWVKPNEQVWEMEVRLLSADGVVRQTVSVPFTPLYSHSQTVLVVAAKDASPAIIPALGTNRSLDIIRVTADELPDRPEGYGRLASVLLDGVSLYGLPVDQRRALQRWVSKGGWLLVTAGRNVKAWEKGFLAEMLPLEVTGSEVVPIRVPETPLYREETEALLSGEMVAITRGGARHHRSSTLPRFEPEQSLTVATGRLRPGAVALWEDEEQRPLVSARRWGEGGVLLVALDGNAYDFRTWSRLGPFYESLASYLPAAASMASPQKYLPGLTSRYAPSSSYAYYMPPELFGDIPSLDQVVFDTAALRVPTLWSVMAFLFGYVLVVGPLEFFLLRRLRRPHWTWVTFPCTVALFTAGAYVAAGKLKGREALVNELTILRQHGREIAAETVFGVYSPRRARRDIGVRDRTAFVEPGGALREGEEQTMVVRSSSHIRGGYLGPMPSAAPVHYASSSMMAPSPMPLPQDVSPYRQDDAGMWLQDVLINQWSMESFRANWWLEPGEVIGELAHDEEELRGDVANRTKLAFDDSFLLWKNRVYRLGALTPGASAEVPADFTKPTLTKDESLAEMERQAMMSYRGGFPMREIAGLPQATAEALSDDARPEVAKRKQALATQVLTPLDYWEWGVTQWGGRGHTLMPPDTARFYGWIEGPLTAVTVSDEDPTRLGLSLYTASLVVKQEPSQ